MRLALGVILLLALALPARAEQSIADKIKKVFATPTPTPARKKKRSSSSGSGEKKATPTPSPSASPKKRSSPKPEETPSPEPTTSASPKSKSQKHKKKTSPTPSPTPTASPSQTPTPTPEPSATPSPEPTPSPPAEKKKGAPATVPPERIVEYEKYSPAIRKVADLALDLTRRNLDYKYGSADPSAGGMDCSGFIHYVLTQNGVSEVPRDSSQQYVWARKAGTFRAVNSHRDDSFELEELTPGDLLFWTGTYSIERDPPITHVMIYLGREKGTNKRIMVGASDGRSYNGESRYGVSVFDFKVTQQPRDNDAKLRPNFIGYAHVPGLRD